MRRFSLAAFVLAITVAVSAYLVRLSAKPLSFRAHLTGDNVYPAVKTLAVGDATFELNLNGDELAFMLIVRSIENVTDAHIHAGAKADSLGQLLVTLYKDGDRPGRVDGTLAKGAITTKDFRGPLMDQPMSALITMFADGLAFVDVHTELHPMGEIRGPVE